MIPRRSHSTARATKAQPPMLPTIPYISLPGRHLSNYFTEERIRKHLLQAGLLTKDGHIITEAEYQSKQKDIAIGNENRQKRDDAILEVLNELGDQHNKLLNNHLQVIKQDLLHQFRRIEEQYSRRTQPIKITVTNEGRVEQKLKIDRPQFPRTIPSLQISHELKSIQQKLTELTTNQSILEQRLNMLSANKRGNALLWTLQHTVNQFKENQDNVQKQLEKLTQKIDPQFDLRHQQTDQMVHASTVITDTHLPSPITRTDVENSVRESMGAVEPSESNNADVATLSPAVNDKSSQFEKRLNDSVQSNNSCVTHPMVEALIRETILRYQSITSQTLVVSQSDIDLQKRIEMIERRLHEMSPVKDSLEIESRPSVSLANPITTNTVYIDDSHIALLQKQLDDHATDMTNLREQINELKYTKIDPSGDRKLVKTNKEKTRPAVNYLETHVHHDCQDVQLPDIIHEINTHSTIIEKLCNQSKDLDHKEPDLQTVERSIQESIKPIIKMKLQQTEPDQRLAQPLIDESKRRGKAYVGNLPPSAHEKWQDSGLSNILQQIQDLATVLRQSTQQSTPQFQPSLPLSFKKDEDFQAIMPFIEVLPTFNLFADEDWN